jgi:hypothetical protein
MNKKLLEKDKKEKTKEGARGRGAGVCGFASTSSVNCFLKRQMKRHVV